MRSNQRALQRLRTACERAKCTLSSSTQAHIEIDSLFEGIDFDSTITRARFEDMNQDNLRKCLTLVERVVKDASMSKAKIHEVVLVGGSTRIPMVRQILREYFDGKELCMSINPDEAVAFGATVQAGILARKHLSEKLSSVLLLEVALLGHGLETEGGIMTTLIERNTVLPTKKSKMISTYVDNQRWVLVQVYEGDHTRTRGCNLLGKFTLDGISLMPRGQPQIEVTFSVDANGIIDAHAVDKSTGKENSITVTKDEGRLSANEIVRMVERGERYKAEDNVQRQRIECKNSCENYAYSVRKAIKEEMSTIEEKISETIAWLDAYPSAEKEEYEGKKKELKTVCNLFIQKMAGEGGMSDMNGARFPGGGAPAPGAEAAAWPKIEEID